MAPYNKTKVDDIICVFDCEAMPKQDYDQTYFKQRLFQFESGNRYKYSLLENPEEKDNYVKATSLILSQLVGVCGKIYRPDAREKAMSFKIVDKENEKKVVSTFINEIVDKYKDYNVLFVTYNGLNYDAPLIMRKAVQHGVPLQNKSFTNLAKFRRAPHYDVCAIISNWGGEIVDFETICREFGIENPKDGPTNASNIAESSNEEIGIYCMKDVEATDEMFQKMKDVYHIQQF